MYNNIEYGIILDSDYKKNMNYERARKYLKKNV